MSGFLYFSALKSWVFVFFVPKNEALPFQMLRFPFPLGICKSCVERGGARHLVGPTCTLTKSIPIKVHMWDILTACVCLCLVPKWTLLLVVKSTWSTKLVCFKANFSLHVVIYQSSKWIKFLIFLNTGVNLPHLLLGLQVWCYNLTLVETACLRQKL